ncbi:hypothetical protein N9W17_04650 [Jannaschia sp.]|nr:hypothetical protein [Jannaschia sp.]
MARAATALPCWVATADQKDVFAEIVTRDLRGTVPAIRELLAAYRVAFGGEDRRYKQPWYEGDDSIASLGYALRALILLDVGSLSDWETYVEGRNEHEGFSISLFPEFAARHGWSDPRVVEAAIFIAVEKIRAGYGPACSKWIEDGLFDRAEFSVNPEWLSNAILRRIVASDLDEANSLDMSVTQSLGLCLRKRAKTRYFATVLADLNLDHTLSD